MCRKLYEGPKCVASNVGELRKWCYPISVPFDDGLENLSPDNCLCCVNFKELARRLKVRIESTEDQMDYEVLRDGVDGWEVVRARFK